jgi:SAM-dependent methyltransferase
MTPALFAEFDALCRRFGASGNVLEIGATSTPDTLLNLPSLRTCESRIGINIAYEATIPAGTILRGNGNDLSRFPDDRFDVVVSNATLEHDPRFWLTLAEMRRVLKPGGLLLIGVPGYTRARSWMRRVAGRMGNSFRVLAPFAQALQGFGAGTATLLVHDYPGDYFRFSEQAMREVLLQNMFVLTTCVLGTPPRLLGVGRKLTPSASLGSQNK